ncbi:MAG: F0F1 ATP synthase subunit B [Patescibacteria group bacterium]
MESLVETFHLDLKLLIAQIVNFVIVLLVLWFFALKPLIKLMNERTNKIEKSLQDAQDIEIRLTKTDKAVGEKLDLAKKEANNIITEAQKQTEQNRQEATAKTKREVEAILVQAKAQIQGEKDKMLTEVKSEVADLVVATAKKVLGVVVNKEIDKKLIEEATKEIK